MHAEIPTIENGFVLLPETAPWLADTLAEFLAFPKGRHDDQVELDRMRRWPGRSGGGEAPTAGWSFIGGWRGRGRWGARDEMKSRG